MSPFAKGSRAVDPCSAQQWLRLELCIATASRRWRLGIELSFKTNEVFDKTKEVCFLFFCVFFRFFNVVLDNMLQSKRIMMIWIFGVLEMCWLNMLTRSRFVESEGFPSCAQSAIGAWVRSSIDLDQNGNISTIVSEALQSAKLLLRISSPLKPLRGMLLSGWGIGRSPSVGSLGKTLGSLNETNSLPIGPKEDFLSLAYEALPFCPSPRKMATLPFKKMVSFNGTLGMRWVEDLVFPAVQMDRRALEHADRLRGRKALISLAALACSFHAANTLSQFGSWSILTLSKWISRMNRA